MHDPDRWREFALGDVASVTVGGTPSTAVASFWGGDVPWMASGDVHQRRIVEVPGRISALGLRSSNATLVDPPSVAIGLAGQGKTRGTAALVERRLCTNQSVALISGDAEHVLTSYLFHDLDRRYEELRTSSSGGGRGGLSKAILERIPLRLPSMREQSLISQILDTVDEAVRSTESLIAKLEQMTQGFLHDLLTRGVNDNGELRDLVSHPEEFIESPIGLIPRAWSLSTVHSEFDVRSGITLGPERAPVRNASPYLRVANVYRGRLALDDVAFLQASKTERAEYSLRMDDLLVVEGHANPHEIGRCASVTAPATGLLYQNHLFRLRARRMSPRFSELWLNSSVVRSYWYRTCSSSSGLNTINSKQLKAVLVAVPLPHEQESIVRAHESMFDRLRSERNVLDKLQDLRAGLMDDLLTGRVRVKVDEEDAA